MHACQGHSTLPYTSTTLRLSLHPSSPQATCISGYCFFGYILQLAQLRVGDFLIPSAGSTLHHSRCHTWAAEDFCIFPRHHHPSYRPAHLQPFYDFFHHAPPLLFHGLTKTKACDGAVSCTLTSAPDNTDTDRRGSDAQPATSGSRTNSVSTSPPGDTPNRTCTPLLLNISTERLSPVSLRLSANGSQAFSDSEPSDAVLRSETSQARR